MHEISLVLKVRPVLEPALVVELFSYTTLSFVNEIVVKLPVEILEALSA